MCEFCEGGEPVRASGRGCETSARVIWEKGRWRLMFEAKSYGLPIEMKLDVDYCPMCGRRLTEGGER